MKYSCKQLKSILSLYEISFLFSITGKIIKSVPGKLMKEVSDLFLFHSIIIINLQKY